MSDIDTFMEENRETRKLATIQEIKNVLVHPNADKLEIVEVLGWKCCVKKGEFRKGDYCVYFEVDSLIPSSHEWIKFLVSKDSPDKPVRIKTIRLRQQLSQGLALPVSILSWLTPEWSLKAGTDISNLLKIEKYEPYVPAEISGEVRGKIPFPITDELRIQSYPELIEEFKGRQVYVTMKMDGCSSSHGITVNDEFHVCGRNWSLKDNETNSHWVISRKYDISNKLWSICQKTANRYAIQGELCGPGIQENRIGLPALELFVFNVIDMNVHKYLGYNEFVKFIHENGLMPVPRIEICEFRWTSVDELLAYADTFVYPSGHFCEGVVIRPVEEFHSEVLGGRASFKVISNRFLEKVDKRK